jgi:hypothetical protein
MGMQRGGGESLPVRLFQNRRLALEAYRNMIAEEEEAKTKELGDVEKT